MWRLAVFCAILAVVNGQTTNVLPCTENPGDLPVNMYLEGCTQPPCDLPQLENAVIDIVFIAPRTMRSMKTVATAYLTVFGIVIEQPHELGDQSHTCNFLTNTYCPVLQNEIIQYRLLMFIETWFFVGTQATVEFSILDEFDEAVTCFRMPIRVVPANPAPRFQLDLKGEDVPRNYSASSTQA